MAVAERSLKGVIHIEDISISIAGLQLIKNSEGFRSTQYLDTSGLPTIGYGHRIQAGEYPSGITEAAATLLLQQDVLVAQDAVDRLVTVSLSQGQYDALVDFCYNLGQGTLASSTLLKLLNADEYDAAREQLLLWDHSDGVVLAGLKTRREAEYVLWNA